MGNRRISARIHYKDEQTDRQQAGGWDFLWNLLDRLEQTTAAQTLIKEIQGRRACTRPGYPPRSMLRMFWLKYLLGEPTMVDFLRLLRASDVFRDLCGLGNRVPSGPTCSRFYGELRTHAVDIDQLTASLVNQLRRHFTDLGRVVAVDGTDIESWANPRRKTKSDPNAAWGVRTTKNKTNGEPKEKSRWKKRNSPVEKKKQKKDEEHKTEWFFGYKLHCLMDVTYGIPLVYVVLPANESEMTRLPVLVSKALRTYRWFRPEYLLADKGYDSQNNHRYLLSEKIAPIIDIRQSSASDGLHDGIYSRAGIPTCDGKTKMEYVLTDPETGRHLYRCPAEGCVLKPRSSGAVRYCDTTDHREDPKDNPRVISVVARASKLWKELYKLRTVIERWFSSAKRSRLLNGSLYLTMSKVATNCAMSIMTYVATALSKVEAGDIENMCIMDLGI